MFEEGKYVCVVKPFYLQATSYQVSARVYNMGDVKVKLWECHMLIEKEGCKNNAVLL